MTQVDYQVNRETRRYGGGSWSGKIDWEIYVVMHLETEKRGIACMSALLTAVQRHWIIGQRLIRLNRKEHPGIACGVWRRIDDPLADDPSVTEPRVTMRHDAIRDDTIRCMYILLPEHSSSRGDSSNDFYMVYHCTRTCSPPFSSVLLPLSPFFYI